MGSSFPPCVIFLALILTGKCAQEPNHKIWRERITIQRRSAQYGSCKGIFSTASHCWSFDEAQANKTPDKTGGVPATLQNGARIADSLTRGKVASTIDKDSWIDLGNFKGKCISDPDLCPNGITMMFWAKIEKMDVVPNPSVPRYIFSSGGSDGRSRGFSFFHQNDMYVLQVANSKKKWRKAILNTKIPSNKWFSFAFTWDKESGLTYFVNGRQESFKVQPTDLGSPRANNFHEFTISKPNNKHKAKEQMLPMKIDKFVTWPRVLEPNEITKAFSEGGGLPENVPQVAQNLRACLPKNPCLNGGACKIDGDEPKGYRCVCLPQHVGLRCEQKQVLSDSKDNVDDSVIKLNEYTTPTAASTKATTPSKTAKAASTKATAASTTATAAGTTATGAGTTATGAGTTPTAATSASPPTSASASPPTSTPPTAGATTAVPSSTPLPTTIPTSPSPVVTEQTSIDLVAEINRFRRLHCSSGVMISEKINQLAKMWATTIAAQGVAKKDNSSMYGQLVCKYSGADSIAKACASKWYSYISFYDWAEPKLTNRSSPFTQMVWKSSKDVGVGITKGSGGEVYVVVFIDPGQNENEKVQDNVLPVTGMSQPAPQATCPEGFSMMMGGRSCFAVVNIPLNWYDALRGCLSKNGTLASLESSEEEHFVAELLKHSKTSEAWIGLKDNLKEGRYFWVDGSPIPFSDWLQGEPNGNEAENCIVQATGNFSPGWADRHCFDAKPFVCKQPLPGYTTYKMIFNVTEAQTNQQNFYSTGMNIMCTSYVESGNSQLQQAIINYFQAKSITVQPIVNPVRCLLNGVSSVEVTLSLGPEAPPDIITSFQRGIEKNGGVLKLSGEASASLESVEFVCPGASSCPDHCEGVTCQPGCEPSCCTQSTTQQFPAPQVVYQPQPTAISPVQCPYSCTHSGKYCPPYCSSSCCKRRSRVRIHTY